MIFDGRVDGNNRLRSYKNAVANGGRGSNVSGGVNDRNWRHVGISSANA